MTDPKPEDRPAKPSRGQYKGLSDSKPKKAPPKPPEKATETPKTTTPKPKTPQKASEKAKPKLTGVKPRIPTKYLTFGAGAATLILILGIAGFAYFTSSNDESAQNANRQGYLLAQQESIKVSDTVNPNSESENPDVVSFQERFGGVVYSISQQPLVVSDEGRQTSAKDFATTVFRNENTNILSSDKGEVYIQDNSQGVRTAILEYSDLLIIITAPSAASDEGIVQYINALEWR